MLPIRMYQSMEVISLTLSTCCQVVTSTNKKQKQFQHGQKSLESSPRFQYVMETSSSRHPKSSAERFTTAVVLLKKLPLFNTKSQFNTTLPFFNTISHNISNFVINLSHFPSGIFRTKRTKAFLCC